MIRDAIDGLCFACAVVRYVAIWGLIAASIAIEGCGTVFVSGDKALLLNPGQIPQKDVIVYQDATKIGIHVEASGYGADVGYIKLRTTTVPICRENGAVVVPRVTQTTGVGVSIRGDNTISDTLTIGGQP